jgi:hypothetical protein
MGSDDRWQAIGSSAQHVASIAEGMERRQERTRCQNTPVNKKPPDQDAGRLLDDVMMRTG